MVTEPSGSASVRKVYFGLGSNLDEREKNLIDAVLSLHVQFPVVAFSSIYETSPVGFAEQPDFLNMAVESVIKNHNPSEVLSFVKIIEGKLGRVPTHRWGPRRIDVDILHIESVTMQTKELTLPHPELFHRNFVLVPLSEITPSLIIDGRRHSLNRSIRVNRRKGHDRVVLFRDRRSLSLDVS
jgi:2-amino-4-hydroxy-6-hydroxymethyldihydropteridine diphosphokinase